jgi:uncharacterized protein with PIN domain
VRFWDTSALVPTVVPEAATSRVRRWMAEDNGVIVWTLTRVEILSTLARLRRQARTNVADSAPRMRCRSEPPSSRVQGIRAA